MGRKGFRQRISIFKAPPERNRELGKKTKAGVIASVKTARGRTVRNRRLEQTNPGGLGGPAEDLWSFPNGIEKSLGSVKMRTDIIQFLFLHRLHRLKMLTAL